MSAPDDWTERTESVQARIQELSARLEGEDRAIFTGLVGELAEVFRLAEALL